MVSIRSMLGQNNGKIRLLEAYDRNSRETVRNVVGDDGQSFHGVGSPKAPILALISPLKRASLMIGFKDNPQQNICRPLCAAFDVDSGGNVTDIPTLVALLASKGISMVVIEDKCVYEPGKKVNSLGKHPVCKVRRIRMSLPTSYGRSTPPPHIRR